LLATPGSRKRLPSKDFYADDDRTKILAQQAHVKRLVLSHRMLRTLGKESQSLSEIRKNFSGPVAFANDLDCFRVP
jgi:ribonuclease BN (tRNA processing enzyme)